MWEYNNTDELYHYGILGMKWGRRKAKYQEYKADRKNRREYKADKWLAKQNAKDKAKQQYINKVDSKVNKYGVKRVVNVNRAKMAGHVLGAGAGAAAVTIGTGIPLYNKYKGPAGRSYLNMMTATGKKLASDRKSLNPFKHVGLAKRTTTYIKDTEMIRKDHKKWAIAAGIGTAVVAGIAAKKIYDLHKENRTAKDYEYRKYVKRKKKK